MKKNDGVLKNAEQFVRSVIEEDFKQKVDIEILQRAAAKAALAIPLPRRSQTSAKLSRHRLPVSEKAD
jgi:hypothetical protein